ncbi:MAG: hypothetical protein MUE71_03185 [Chitinophagaceae bacterium]|jgi:hypothetical protein|nr:hypothetical protein [Chitinophagaceae bacterium]MCU0404647.1 hypothetical protein [Chitinophagaceae bacterium]
MVCCFLLGEGELAVCSGQFAVPACTKNQRNKTIPKVLRINLEQETPNNIPHTQTNHKQ